MLAQPTTPARVRASSECIDNEAVTSLISHVLPKTLQASRTDCIDGCTGSAPINVNLVALRT